MNKIAIISANYYKKVCDLLEIGVKQNLEKNGLQNYEIIYVPGAFEIPAGLNFAIKSKKYDGFIALGCILKGETAHYDFICNAVFQQISSIIVQGDIAFGLGIITANNLSQAMERADFVKQDVGGNAARAMLKMMGIKEKYGI